MDVNIILFIFFVQKHELVFSELFIVSLLALDDHSCKIYCHISALRARYYKRQVDYCNFS